MTQMPRVWSPLQSAVFDAVAANEANLLIEACAGSGKTTTIIEAMSHCFDDEALTFVAFNKAIAAELQHRVPPGVQAMTLHSMGLRTITKASGDRPKLEGRLVELQLRKILGEAWALRDHRDATASVVSLAKGTLRSDLDALADDYGIDFPPDGKGPSRAACLEAAAKLLRQDSLRATIDFDDMVWLPVVNGIAPQRSDRLFVDETQDLNAAQLALVMSASDRIVAVGDRNQAIYGFRGADEGAMDRMHQALDAVSLPLSICYRCPALVVAEAQKWVASIQPSPNAAGGYIGSTSVAVMLQNAMPGQMIVSRTNAPLISACYKLLLQGKRAFIRGREDLGKGLSRFVKARNATDIPNLMALTRAWGDAEVARLDKAGRSFDAVLDKVDCIIALSKGCGTIEASLSRLDTLFGEMSPATAICLSSTHKAKGLEAGTVWVLRDTYRPYDSDQERNLLYVAITRAQESLIYVKGD